MKFTDWMNDNIARVSCGFQIAKQMKTNSGLKLSVQASSGHYCEPRVALDDFSGYHSFEVGFPTEVIEEFLPYAEDSENPTQTVYCCVPADLIQQVIDNNGGIII